MLVPILFLIALALLGIAAYFLRGRAPESPAHQRPAGCCGQHAVCEKEALLAAMSKDIEYYDDEHLDRFRCTRPEDYTEAETEEFREVLSSMLPSDVAGWVRSLQLRSIDLPTEIREEVIMIVEEQRAGQ